jgi:hypothetical protein
VVSGSTQRCYAPHSFEGKQYISAVHIVPCKCAVPLLLGASMDGDCSGPCSLQQRHHLGCVHLPLTVAAADLDGDGQGRLLHDAIHQAGQLGGLTQQLSSEASASHLCTAVRVDQDQYLGESPLHSSESGSGSVPRRVTSAQQGECIRLSAAQVLSPHIMHCTTL